MVYRFYEPDERSARRGSSSRRLTLRLGMALAAAEPAVRCELREGSAESFESLGTWTCTTEEIGLPSTLSPSETLYAGCPFSCPEALRNGLKEALRDHPEGRVLWLEFVKPYGYLCLVPWERLLQEWLRRPILRLASSATQGEPRRPRRLRMAFVASTPIAKPDFQLVDYIERFAAGLSNLEIEPHVFTEKPYLEELEKRLGDRWRVHQPTQETSPAPDWQSGAGTLSSPWLIWVREVLGRQGIDVVHFIAHGFLSGSRGALAMAESPLKNQDQRRARFVRATELKNFLTQVGAEGVVLSSPRVNYSEMGLRAFADGLAREFSGTVVHHELGGDHDGTLLAKAHRCLFYDTAGAPRTPALIVYSHPDKIPESRSRGFEAEALTTKGTFAPPLHWPMAADAGEEDAAEPLWLAVVRRQLEERRREVKRGGASSRSRGAVDALNRIEDILARFSGDSGGSA